MDENRGTAGKLGPKFTGFMVFTLAVVPISSE